MPIMRLFRLLVRFRSLCSESCSTSKVPEQVVKVGCGPIVDSDVKRIKQHINGSRGGETTNADQKRGIYARGLPPSKYPHKHP